MACCVLFSLVIAAVVGTWRTLLRRPVRATQFAPVAYRPEPGGTGHERAVVADTPRRKTVHWLMGAALLLFVALSLYGIFHDPATHRSVLAANVAAAAASAPASGSDMEAELLRLVTLNCTPKDIP